MLAINRRVYAHQCCRPIQTHKLWQHYYCSWCRHSQVSGLFWLFSWVSRYFRKTFCSNCRHQTCRNNLFGEGTSSNPACVRIMHQYGPKLTINPSRSLSSAFLRLIKLFQHKANLKFIEHSVYNIYGPGSEIGSINEMTQRLVCLFKESMFINLPIRLLDRDQISVCRESYASHRVSYIDNVVADIGAGWIIWWQVLISFDTRFKRNSSRQRS